MTDPAPRPPKLGLPSRLPQSDGAAHATYPTSRGINEAVVELTARVVAVREHAYDTYLGKGVDLTRWLVFPSGAALNQQIFGLEEVLRTLRRAAGNAAMGSTPEGFIDI